MLQSFSNDVISNKSRKIHTMRPFCLRSSQLMWMALTATSEVYTLKEILHNAEKNLHDAGKKVLNSLKVSEDQ